MVSFKAVLQKFNKQGEKTGWTYFVVPQKLADKLNPGCKKSYRVKGMLDEHKIRSVSMLPMGDGDFIIPFNAAMRKATMKRHGDSIKVSLEPDTAPVKISPELLECLEDEPAAKQYFHKLPGSHRNYYSKWIESAKTDTTKAKRIALALSAFARKMSFAEMLREEKGRKI